MKKASSKPIVTQMDKPNTDLNKKGGGSKKKSGY